MHVTSPLDTPTACGGANEVLFMLGDRWTMLVVISLSRGSLRFNEIRRTVGGVSQQMLTRTLRTLERDGVAIRTVLPTKPPQVEYTLTQLGHSLAEAVVQLGRWARANHGAIQENRRRYDASH